MKLGILYESPICFHSSAMTDETCCLFNEKIGSLFIICMYLSLQKSLKSGFEDDMFVSAVEGEVF